MTEETILDEFGDVDAPAKRQSSLDKAGRTKGQQSLRRRSAIGRPKPITLPKINA